MTAPSCCNRPAVWVDNVPTKEYWFCRSCKKEVVLHDPFADAEPFELDFAYTQEEMDRLIAQIDAQLAVAQGQTSSQKAHGSKP